MDGHEHADVTEYWMNTYLPAMTKFEACMVHFDGPNLEWTEPTLKPNEKEIVALYLSGHSFSFFILSYCYLILSYYLATSGIEPRTCRHMAKSGPCYDLGGSRPT